jgi:hypothetical protein
MQCPHCLVNFHWISNYSFVGKDTEGTWYTDSSKCPACEKVVVYLILSLGASTSAAGRILSVTGIRSKILIRPKGVQRPPCPNQVPKEIAEDYTEACLIIADSPKASAALSRRALQHLLRDAAGVSPGNLADEIQQVLDTGKLPSHIAESIDAVRNIGNFSAHPLKSKQTGDIVPVEPQEADWNLDVLEALFYFYYVQSDLIKKKRAALNQKLADAGKPPMK